MTVKFFSILISVVFLGCSFSYADKTKWEFLKVANVRSLALLKVNDRKVISRLIDSYKKSPYEESYKEIVFNKTLSDQVNKEVYYIFDVLYVDDIFVVYVLNQQGRVVRNFLLSEWDM